MHYALLLSLFLPLAASSSTENPQLNVTTGHYQRWLITNAQGNVFDIQNASTVNGALLGLWSYWGGANQQWQLRAGANGSYSIVNGNGKLVTVKNSSTDLGATINQWDNTNQSNQHFRIQPVSDQRYTIVNVQSNLCLSAQGTGSAGALVVQGACNATASIWRFYAIDDRGAIVAP